MNYSDLDLKKNIETDTFKWKDKEIQILKYLPIDDKYDIIMITLQKSFEEGIYNPIKLDLFFHLNLVYLYTDLEFTQEERNEETKLYDEMKSSGFLDEFLKYVNPNEYKEMQEDIEDIAELSVRYKASAASVLRSFINDLPANVEAATKMVENFDPEKYQAVVDFAKSANGGRALPKEKVNLD